MSEHRQPSVPVSGQPAPDRSKGISDNIIRRLIPDGPAALAKVGKTIAIGVAAVTIFGAGMTTQDLFQASSLTGAVAPAPSSTRDASPNSWLPRPDPDSPNVVSGLTEQVFREELVRHVNDERRKLGLGPLVVNSKLDQSASLKLNDLVANKYWSHYSNTGQAPWLFFDQAGYPYLQAGENLAMGYSTPQRVVQGWLDSPAHRANMTSATYTEMGHAVYYGAFLWARNVVIVQHLAQPLQR